MTDAHGVDPVQEIEWIPTMKLSGSRSGNRVDPYGEIRWIPKRKFCTLKRLIPDYARIEKVFNRVLRKCFGLPEEMSSQVHQADRILLATEKRDLMPYDGTPWPILDEVEPLPDRIVPWTPERSLVLFLRRFAELSRTHSFRPGLEN